MIRTAPLAVRVRCSSQYALVTRSCPAVHAMLSRRINLSTGECHFAPHATAASGLSLAPLSLN